MSFKFGIMVLPAFLIRVGIACCSLLLITLVEKGADTCEVLAYGFGENSFTPQVRLQADGWRHTSSKDETHQN
jgi:hypothetical protein